MTAYTLEQVAQALGVGKDAAKKRAARESWPYTEETCRGGRRRLYRFEDLPAEVQMALAVWQTKGGRNETSFLRDGQGHARGVNPSHGQRQAGAGTVGAVLVDQRGEARSEALPARIQDPAGGRGRGAAVGEEVHGRNAECAEGQLKSSDVAARSGDPTQAGLPSPVDSNPAATGAGGGVAGAGGALPDDPRALAGGAEYPAACSSGGLPAVSGSSGAAGVFPAPTRTEALWEAFLRRPLRVQEEAKRRFAILMEARRLADAGVQVRQALKEAAQAAGVPYETVVGWYYGRGRKPGVVGQPVGDWVPLLAPDWGVQCQREARFTDAAWAWAQAQYLRPERPSASRVYRDLKALAPLQGWEVPSYDTFERRLKRLPWALVVLAREGRDALEGRMPSLQRSVRHLEALEFVNADGHRFDVFVRIPERFGGGIGRPHLVAWQDIYSRKILAWRLTPTLNAYSVQLSFADLVETYGVPDEALMDNGREFGAMAMTGGVPWRFRFKVKDDEPLGMLPMLGVKVHFTTPFHGQSKPIERAFKDLCEEIAKDPRCAGAYTGNAPDAKPENYGSKAIAWEEFEQIVAEGIARHNAMEGRRTETARGRSFDAVFAESYAKRVVKKLSPSQRALLLLAVAGVTVRRDASVLLLGNRYGHPELGAFVGEQVVVRFDPDRLDKPVRVERLDGVHICDADPMWAPFDDQLVAQAHGRGKRRLAKLYREQLDVIRRLGAIEARVPVVEVPAPPSPAAVEIVRATQKTERLDMAEAERYSRLAEAAILDLGRRMAV